MAACTLSFYNYFPAIFIVLFYFSPTSATASISHETSKEILFYHHLSLSRDYPASNLLLSRSTIRACLDNSYLLKEFMDKAFGASILYKKNLFSLSVAHAGYSKYGRFNIVAGYGKLFAGKIAIASRFYYLLEHASQYSPRHSFTFDISCQLLLNDKIGFGFCVYNPARLKYGVTGQNLIPISFRFNCHVKLNRSILFWGETYFELLSSFLDITLGTSYYHSSFYINGGVGLSSVTLQIGFHFQKLYFNIDAKYHYQLGLSPGVSICYTL